MDRVLPPDAGRPAIGRNLSLAFGGTAGLLAVAHGVNDMFTSMVPALLPALQARFGLAESGAALLVGAFAFSSSFLGPFLGGLSDRFGARLVTAFGIAFSAVFLSLIGAAPSVSLLFVLLLVGGLGSAALHPAGSALARAAGARRAGLALGLFSAGGMAGYALGPLLILFVAERFGVAATAWLMVPGLLAAALVYAVAPPDPAAPAEGARGFDRSLFAGPVGVLTAAGTLNSLVTLTFVSAFPLWLVQSRGLATDDALIGLTLGVFSMASAVGGVVAGLVSLRVRREILIAASMVLAIAPLSLLFSLEPGSAAFFVSVALAGGLSYAGVPLMVLGAQDLAPRQIAAASGMLFGFAGGMAGVLYVGLGRLQDAIGLGPAMGLTYLALVPAALLALRALRRVPDVTPLETGSALEVACACLGAAACGCPASRSWRVNSNTVPEVGRAGCARQTGG